MIGPADDRWGLRYLDALDAGDWDVLAALNDEAALDPQKAAIIEEIEAGLFAEERAGPSLADDALRVRDWLDRALVSARGPGSLVGAPLLAQDVARALLADPVTIGRWPPTDRAANARLSNDPTPLPQRLGARELLDWSIAAQVVASPRYGKDFQRFAVLLAMGRSPSAPRLAARSPVRSGFPARPIDDAGVKAAVEATYRSARLAWPPNFNGPAPLEALIVQYPLAFAEVPGLNHAKAAEFLARRGSSTMAVPSEDPELSGLVVAGPLAGCLLVNANDPVTRRRFDAAHELGHYRLHLPEGLGQDMLVQSDQRRDEDAIDRPAHEAREREADRFAAELLMPEPICRAIVERESQRAKLPEAFLVERLASALLVSRPAARRRLIELGLLGAGQ